MSDENQTRILILGAGFAGLYTALHLEEHLGEQDPAEITLMDQDHYHLFTPMLHEAATGVIPMGLIQVPIRRILHGRRVRFLRARVDAIDLEAQVVTACCARVPYDILVIALGSETNFYGLESVREQAFEFKSARDADQVRCHVINCFEAATREDDPQRRRALLTFVVVGGGCTGVEVVTELHEFLEHLRQEQYADVDSAEVRTVLVEALGSVLSQMGTNLSRAAMRRMQRLGIEVWLDTQVTNLAEGELVFAGDRDPLPTETLIWTAGVRAPRLLDGLSMEKDRLGRIVVDSTLRVPGMPHVYVLGDAAHAAHPGTGDVYPPTAQVAYRQARVAAANIVADVRGGAHQPFDFTYIGDLVSLGRLSGVADPYGVELRGLPAWLMWKFYYLLNLAGWQNRLRVAFNWLLALLSPINSASSPQCLPDCDEELCLLVEDRPYHT